MKKLFFIIAMLAFSTGIMAQEPEQNHTKPFDECKRILEKVLSEVQVAKDCEALEEAMFGIFELYSVEDIDKMTAAEEEFMDNLSERYKEALKQKKAELNCVFADEEE